VRLGALRLAVLPGCVVLGLYAEWASLRRGPAQEAPAVGEIRLAVADLGVGLVFFVCGLVIWTRRESRTGPLLAAAGFFWFLGTFAASGDSGYADFGALFLTLHRGPLVHALLSYPNGRLEHRAEQAAVAVAYVLSAMPEVGGTPGAGIVLAVIVLGVGAYRFARATGPARRARATAAIAIAAFSAVLLVSGLARAAGSGAALDRGVLWAYDIVLAGVAVGLTLDLILGRWVSATVTGLVVDLGETTEAGTLRDRLADALGDRSLALGYRLDTGVYVDDRGRELELPEEGGDRRVTTVTDGGEAVAALVHDAAVLASPDLIRSVAAAARIAVVNARLQAAVLRQVDELEASRRRIVEAGDAERRRLEGELREGAEQRLVDVETLLDEAAHRAQGGIAVMLAETQAKLEQTRSELREFARGIHPRVLTDRGLAASLAELAERSATPVELRVPDVRYAAPVEAAAYFVCSEALANIGKYAEASGAVVGITERDGLLVVAVSDDGKGGASLDKGSGLRGLADRLEVLHGRLTVTSPGGEGTQLVAEIPLD
jgi:signal transduction histidine kinase